VQIRARLIQVNCSDVRGCQEGGLHLMLLS